MLLAKWTTPQSDLADRIARSGWSPTWQRPVFDALFQSPDRMLDAEVHETPEALTLSIDLPGHDPKNVDVKIEGDVLTVKSQRSLRSGAREEYARSFVVPDTVDATKAEARCEHGVLTVVLPRREEARPRSITVKVS
ncbi:MAG: Hsp20/alpha crystallin family protein [Myxococcaceae bacterium]